MTAVAVGGAMPKDDGARTLLQLGSDGDGTRERLVGSLPSPLLANIICGRRDAAQKRCRLAAMPTKTMTVQMMSGGSK